MVTFVLEITLENHLLKKVAKTFLDLSSHIADFTGKHVTGG